MFHTDDTIAAIASAAGGALRGIVRASGPRVVECLKPCFVPSGQVSLDDVIRATCMSGNMRQSSTSPDLPCELYYWPTERSYTRQPAIEIHTLGSPPLLEAVLRQVCQHGARLAEPGEFTMRAFLAGRLDLTQAEAVLGVIDASDDNELNVALAQLAGGLANPLHQLREQLLDLLSHLEAGLDFVEEDIEFIAAAEVDRQLTQAIDVVTRVVRQIEGRLEAGRRRTVVLTGWPNVGKSSLINALAQSEVAIVSDVAGTTRDYLSRVVDCDGLLVELIDTAGAEVRNDESLQAMAQAQASRQNQQADLRLLCIDRTRPLNAWEIVQVGQTDNRTLVVLTKCDQSAATDYAGPALPTSSEAADGLRELLQEVRSRLESNAVDEAGILGSTGSRCQESMRLTSASLKRALSANADRLGDELVAAELRLALEQLGKVVGAVYTDDLLDRIFGRFCIGK